MIPLWLVGVLLVLVFVAGLFLGGWTVRTWYDDLHEFSRPLRPMGSAQTALAALRMLRREQPDEAIFYLEHRLDQSLKELVWSLREGPRALDTEQFQSMLGRVAEYRCAHPSPHEPVGDEPVVDEAEPRKITWLEISLGAALSFARKYGVINLARPSV